MDDRLILALDQGTTGSTALLVTPELEVVARANVEFPQIYPKPGWVEHNPEDIYNSILEAIDKVLAQRPDVRERIAAIGITNQRETTLLWDRNTHEAVHNAIVWQCRRTADKCDALKHERADELFQARTGLVLDAYFSGTKLAWLLDNVPDARAKAEDNRLAFGTVDTFLVWRLTGGARHVTDTSNASRTLLFNIHELQWDDSLLNLLECPRSVLPEIASSSEVYGTTRGVPGLPDGIPIAGMAGDQQSALFGQACFTPGDLKCTYGTGAFLLQNIGTEPLSSDQGLLTTVAWTLDSETHYALEGSVFIAGAAVQWLRDGLQIIAQAPDIEALAQSVPSSEGVVFVPAFVGLGAPYWDSNARGAFYGITRGTTPAHIARATLEAIALSCQDLVQAIEKDSGQKVLSMKVDGGAAQNDCLMQTQSDLLNAEIVRPTQLETTALGAACLAGLGAGLFTDLDDIRKRWKTDKVFTADPSQSYTASLRSQWDEAVRCTRSFGS
ncbi:MAG: glycerol kinase GlpK [Arenicellales bacterium]|jgi:glycerol kinase|nr:glycerol kinase GlpK [Arenicellales bacterium]